MKHSISFVNPGVIDDRVYSLFGVSAKVNEAPIGYFGTGLKYAIAVWLRLGCEVVLFRGTARVEFTARPMELRGQKFSAVYANELMLPFTTELGKNWQPWQAMRELWCNAIDEKGDMAWGAFEPAVDTTTIVVSGDEVLKAWEVRDTVMLRGEPLAKTAEVEIHDRASKHVYYRGIRVHELKRSSRFTYNILSPVDLTEDRTAKYGWIIDNHLCRAVVGANNEWAIYEALSASNEFEEFHLDLHELRAEHVSPEFMSVVEHRLRNNAHGNPNSIRLWSKVRGHGLDPEEFELSTIERTMLARAKVFCLAMGLQEAKGTGEEALKIRFAADLDTGILGRYVEKTDTVWIAKEAFRQGTKMLAGTLFEELLHARRGLHDCDRSMQNYLINALVSEHEERMGAPL